MECCFISDQSLSLFHIVNFRFRLIKGILFEFPSALHKYGLVCHHNIDFTSYMVSKSIHGGVYLVAVSDVYVHSAVKIVSKHCIDKHLLPLFNGWIVTYFYSCMIFLMRQLP